MAQYEVLIDWNVTSHVVVEADSAEAAEDAVNLALDEGRYRPDGRSIDLYDPQVVDGLTELVEES